jgi:hypothetical protein
MCPYCVTGISSMAVAAGGVVSGGGVIAIIANKLRFKFIRRFFGRKEIL